MDVDATHLARHAITKYRSDGIGSLVRAAIRTSPIFRGERQFDLYTTVRYRIQGVKYAAPANPYRPIWVDLNDVTRQTQSFEKVWGLGQIRGGDWDRPEYCEPIAQEDVYKGLKQRFEQGCDWEETAYYAVAKRWFENSDPVWGYTDLDHFRDVRCRYVDELFRTIREEGYQPNYAGEHRVPENDVRSSKERFSQRLEPLVTIGRDGTVYWKDGFHRLAIADVLGIDSIPVNVLGRHRAWQRVRDEFASVEDVTELDLALRAIAAHPDLQDVV